MLHKSKLMLPILAVIVGVAASAFTTFSKSPKASDTPAYWFKYNANGTALINQTSQPALLMADPYQCSEGSVNCAQAFSSYTEVQVNGQTEYEPGTPTSPTRIDKKEAQ